MGPGMDVERRAANTKESQECTRANSAPIGFLATNSQNDRTVNILGAAPKGPKEQIHPLSVLATNSVGGTYEVLHHKDSRSESTKEQAPAFCLSKPSKCPDSAPSK
eukprot:1142919-Pelagomonas_calceolata.AAC.2